MKDDRRKRIEALVSQRDTVTMEELRDAFGVSMNTVRSDVAYLVGAGAVEKIYGGVRAVQRQEAPLFTQRTQLRTPCTSMPAPPPCTSSTSWTPPSM